VKAGQECGMAFENYRTCAPATSSSASARHSAQNDLIARLGGMLRRSLKVVQIADEDGRPLSMKDRESLS
jgi:hypothetical protein